MPKVNRLLEPARPDRLVAPQIWALLLALPVVVWLLSPEIMGACKPARQKDFVFDSTAAMMVRGDDLPTTFSLSGNWIEKGAGISPGETNTDPDLELAVPPGYWDRGIMRVYGAPGSTWSVRLRRESIDEESGERQIQSSLAVRGVASERRMELSSDDIPAITQIEAPLRVTITPRDHGDSDHALLRRVEIRFTSDRLNPLFFLPGILSLAIAPFVCAMFLRLGYGFRVTRAVMGGTGIGLLFLVLVLRAPEMTRVVAGVMIGLSIASSASAWFASRGWRWRKRKLEVPPEEWRAAALGMLTFCILLLAVFMRWQEFEMARRTDLGWDARGFVQIASRGGWIYSTAQDFAPWVREPFFPWLLRAWFLFAPATDASARLAAMGISLCAIAAVFLAGIRLVGLFPALAAALMMTFAPHWNSMAVQVLRLDVTVILLMLALMCRGVWQDEKWKRAAGLGAIGAALILTRVSQLFFVGVVGVWEIIRKRWKPGEIALAASLIIVLFAPHLYFNYQTGESRDPFYSSTVHSRYYLNREHIGEPGYPATLAEYHRDPYAGEPVGAAAYLFKYHTIGELIAGHAKGYWRIFVWGSPRVDVFGGHEWLMLPGLIGAWALVRTRRWWIALWFILWIFPYAFIASVHHTWRLGGEAQILVMWIWGLGLQEAARLAWKWYQNWRKDAPK